jgi:hypothetical protein
MDLAPLLARLEAQDRRLRELEQGSRVIPSRGGYAPQTSNLLITQASHGFAVGNLLLQPTSGGTWQKAKAGDTGWDTGTIAWVLAVPDSGHALVALAGQVLGTFTAGTTYWMSAASAGAITSTKPSNARQALVAVTSTQAVLMTALTPPSSKTWAKFTTAAWSHAFSSTNTWEQTGLTLSPTGVLGATLSSGLLTLPSTGAYRVTLANYFPYGGQTSSVDMSLSTASSPLTPLDGQFLSYYLYVSGAYKIWNNASLTWLVSGSTTARLIVRWDSTTGTRNFTGFNLLVEEA